MRCSPRCQDRNTTQPDQLDGRTTDGRTSLTNESNSAALYGTGEFVLLGSDASLYRVTRQDWCWGRLLGRRAPPFLCIKLGSNDDHLPPVEYGLPSLFSPLSFKLRFAMRLPQGLSRVPHRQHDAETYDRTDNSEHKAIIYGLGIHLSSHSLCWHPSNRPNNRVASRTEQIAARLFLFNTSSITRYRNSPLVLLFWYLLRDSCARLPMRRISGEFADRETRK